MRRPDHHNEIELNMLQTGWLTYLLGGRKVRIEAGHLSAFWAAIPHQIIDFGSETEYFVATLPLAWFLQCRLPEPLIQPLMHGEVLSDSSPDRVGFDAALFSQWEKDLQDDRRETRDIVILEMEARLRRLAASLPTPKEAKKRRLRLALQDGGLNKVEQMACLVAQRYKEPLTVTEISEAVGLHPNYAMNLFKKTTGMTISKYINLLRLSHAQAQLMGEGANVLQIAMDSGFGSISAQQILPQYCRYVPIRFPAGYALDDRDGRGRRLRRSSSALEDISRLLPMTL